MLSLVSLLKKILTAGEEAGSYHHCYSLFIAPPQAKVASLHSTTEVGRERWRPSSPIHLLELGHPEPVAQDNVQMAFEYFQEGGSTPFLGPPVPVFDHSHRKEDPSDIYKWIIPYSSLWPFTLILPLETSILPPEITLSQGLCCAKSTFLSHCREPCPAEWHLHTAPSRLCWLPLSAPFLQSLCIFSFS